MLRRWSPFSTSNPPHAHTLPFLSDLQPHSSCPVHSAPQLRERTHEVLSGPLLARGHALEKSSTWVTHQINTRSFCVFYAACLYIYTKINTELVLFWFKDRKDPNISLCWIRSLNLAIKLKSPHAQQVCFSKFGFISGQCSSRPFAL